jgi:hypothetical protein
LLEKKTSMKLSFAPVPLNAPSFFLALMVWCSSPSRGADVSFYAIDKAVKYNQGSAALPTIGSGNPYRSGASVASNVSGSVQSATVSASGGAPQPLSFDPVTGWLDFTLKYPTQSALDAAAPAGNYTVVINTLNQGQKTLTLNLPAETFPPALHISNWTAAQAIDPTTDFTLKWDAIAGGTTNDYILVITGSASTGIVNFRSPAPFQPGALNGTSTSIVIPAANLQPSTSYAVLITFVKIVSTDTTSYPGAAGVVTFNAETDSGLLTASSSGRGADVSFYAIDKVVKYSQSGAGLPAITAGSPYRVGASVAPTNSVQSATVSTASGAPQPLSYDPLTGWLDFSLKFATQAGMDTVAPAGPYTVVINTVNQGQKTITLNLPAETFPPAPHISNWTATQAIDPTTDFTLKWDPIAGGTTNDYILVVTGNASTGTVNFRSPSPFQPGALNGTSTSIVIPAATLQPSTAYGVEITLVKIVSTDTTSYPGAVGVVAFNAETDSGLTTASSPGQFSFYLRQFAQGGSFLNNTNATPQFPVNLNAYRTEFTVSGTTNFASPLQVYFTGPAGSDLTNTPCGLSGFVQSGTTGFYFSPITTQPAQAPAGIWSVNYQGTVLNYTLPDPQLASHLVIPVPQVGLSNGVVAKVSWSYYDSSGTAVTPAVLDWIQVQEFNPAGSVAFSSAPLPPSTSSYTFTNSVAWTNLSMLRFFYEDTLTNFYFISYPNVQVTTPTELTGVSYSTGGFVLQLSGQTGHGYRVQFSTDLFHWTDVITTNLPSSTIQLLVHQVGSAPVGFYRASLAY